jgi:hypothetical protein
VRAAPAAHSAAPEPVELQSTDEWHLSLPLLEAGLLRVEGKGSSAWDAPLQLTPAMFDIRRSARSVVNVLTIAVLLLYTSMTYCAQGRQTLYLELNALNSVRLLKYSRSCGTCIYRLVLHCFDTLRRQRTSDRIIRNCSSYCLIMSSDHIVKSEWYLLSPFSRALSSNVIVKLTACNARAIL